MAARESSYAEIQHKVGWVVTPLLLVVIVALYFGHADEYFLSNTPKENLLLALDRSNEDRTIHFLWQWDEHRVLTGPQSIKQALPKGKGQIKVRVLTVHLLSNAQGVPTYRAVLMERFDTKQRAEIYFPLEKGEGLHSLHRFALYNDDVGTLPCAGDEGVLFYDDSVSPNGFRLRLKKPDGEPFLGDKKAEVE